MIFGPYPPLAAEHPIVTNGDSCDECGAVIVAGEIIGLRPMEGQDVAERNIECVPVHWACPPAEAERVRGIPSPAVLAPEFLRVYRDTPNAR